LAGERSILVVVFDDRTTIGMVRLYAKETAAELTKIFQDVQAKAQTGEAAVTGEFADAAGDRLDDIFQD